MKLFIHQSHSYDNKFFLLTACIAMKEFKCIYPAAFSTVQSSKPFQTIVVFAVFYILRNYCLHILFNVIMLYLIDLA